MPILHVIDIARVAHDALIPITSRLPWMDQDQEVREAWIEETQRILDNGALPLLGDVDDQLGDPQDQEVFHALVNAMRRYVEE